MVSLNPPVCDFGWKAPDFKLPGVDGRDWSLEGVTGPKGLLVMFICNHCPYVKSIRERIIRDIVGGADKVIERQDRGAMARMNEH